jgi:hypothetical protein
MKRKHPILASYKIKAKDGEVTIKIKAKYIGRKEYKCSCGFQGSFHHIYNQWNNKNFSVKGHPKPECNIKYGYTVYEHMYEIKVPTISTRIQNEYDFPTEVKDIIIKSMGKDEWPEILCPKCQKEMLKAKDTRKVELSLEKLPWFIQVGRIQQLLPGRWYFSRFVTSVYTISDTLADAETFLREGGKTLKKQYKRKRVQKFTYKVFKPDANMMENAWKDHQKKLFLEALKK